MIIDHKVQIDLVRPGIAPKISVVQGDTYTRRLIIALFSDRIPWQVPENTVITVQYRKPDRSSGAYDTLADGTRAIFVSGNEISAVIAPQILTQSGDVSLMVTLRLGEHTLSTFEIRLWVQPDSTSSLPDDTATPWVSGFLPSPEKASAGQHLVVQKVDEHSHVLSVKAEDLPEIPRSAYELAVENGYAGTEEEFGRQLARGGAEEVAVSSEEPTAEGTKIWIKPDDENEEASVSANIDVLAKVGQTIRVKEVDENGKPTAWEAVDPQERTHWTEIGEIIPQTTMEIDPETGECMPIFIDSCFIKGNQYFVNWNGLDYTCECFSASDNEMTLYFIGNHVMVDGTDTGEPFTIATAILDGMTICVAYSVDETITTFTFSVTGETHTPIPVRYMTNALPYYIEVIGEGTEQYPYVCNDTVANVEAIHKSGRPLVLKTGITMGTFSCNYFMTMMMYSNIINGDEINPYGATIGFCANTGSSVCLYLEPQADGSYLVTDTWNG